MGPRRVPPAAARVLGPSSAPTQWPWWCAEAATSWSCDGGRSEGAGSSAGAPASQVAVLGMLVRNALQPPPRVLTSSFLSPKGCPSQLQPRNHLHSHCILCLGAGGIPGGAIGSCSHSQLPGQATQLPQMQGRGQNLPTPGPGAVTWRPCS